MVSLAFGFRPLHASGGDCCCECRGFLRRLRASGGRLLSTQLGMVLPDFLAGLATLFFVFGFRASGLCGGLRCPTSHPRLRASGVLNHFRRFIALFK